MVVDPPQLKKISHYDLAEFDFKHFCMSLEIFHSFASILGTNLTFYLPTLIKTQLCKSKNVVEIFICSYIEITKENF